MISSAKRVIPLLTPASDQQISFRLVCHYGGPLMGDALPFRQSRGMCKG